MGLIMSLRELFKKIPYLDDELKYLVWGLAVLFALLISTSMFLLKWVVRRAGDKVFLKSTKCSVILRYLCIIISLVYLWVSQFLLILKVLL